jgi:hypothetical protein
MRFATKCVLLAIVASSFATGQESASISGPDIVKAGEPLDLKVTLDQAPNFEGGGVQITIAGPDGFTVQSGCAPKIGEKVCHWIYTLPADSKGGTWFVSSLVFNSGTHQINLPFQKLTFKVLPRTDLIFPTKAEIEVTPSQIQLLRRGETANTAPNVESQCRQGIPNQFNRRRIENQDY